ncbi:hypothetical protein LCGC14_1998070 [marine sediment metagenome]|uniref:Uncharacterized protein n=1 Tax=marine sediment metagenome TaxID=412755 RepID=A0A0F9F490_9ZZZZ
MGTPDTIYFKCPNCGNVLSLQIKPGICDALKIETMCECRTIAWQEQIHGCNKSAICPNCKYSITLEAKEGLRLVKYLEPVIKKE